MSASTTRLFGFLRPALWIGALLLIAAAPARSADAAATAPSTAAATTLEPKAMEILKAMSDRLAAAKSMTFTAVVLYESPSAVSATTPANMNERITRRPPCAQDRG